MNLQRPQLYRLYSKIAYGYILKNYSKSFLSRVKDKIKVIYVTQNKGVVEIFCKYTGNDFKLNINLDKKTIEHRGCYSANRGYNNTDLIDYNIKMLNS